MSPEPAPAFVRPSPFPALPASSLSTSPSRPTSVTDIMPRSNSRGDSIADDGTSVGDDNTYDTSRSAAGGGSNNRYLTKMFTSCEEDAVGSVHRAWAATVLLMTIFFIVSIIEATKLNEAGTAASLALQIASYWSAALHLIVAVVGTVILKRFSTSFTVGFFLGTTVVMSQQNLLLCAAFYHYKHGNVVFNKIFADLSCILFVLLTFFSLILGHFRNYIIVK